MEKLTVTSMGSEVQGVRIKGDPRNPEPESFRVCIPGGDVDIVRCTDGSYWIHVRANHPKDGDIPERTMGRISDARLDIAGQHASDVDAGDFAHPDLYHVAVRLGVTA